MKNIKKLLSIVMVLTLVLALGAQAFAADVKIEGPEGHTYVAYQIFKGDNQAEGNGAIGNLDWSDSINADGFLAALKLDETIGKYFTAAEDAQDVAKALSPLMPNELDAFAKLAMDFCSDGTTLTGGEMELPIGYYVIVDETEMEDGSYDVYNRTVLQVTDDVTVKFKTDKPSSEKKVKDVNDSTGEATDWQDSADYDIGDQVPFQLKATIPAYSTSIYETYELVFHDKESEGLTFKKDSVKVFVNGTQVTEGFDVVTEGLTDGCTFEIVFDDIKTVGGFTEGDSADDVITVEYTSELNAEAVIGNPGNPNTMLLEYSNNPYEEGTGKTPEDKVIVFTYDLDVNKIDGNGKPLEGAKFALYKEDPAGTIQLTEKGEVVDADHQPAKDPDKHYVAVDIASKDGSPTTFYSKGLDDGNYVLVETVTPDGYNTIDPVEFTVKAEHDVLSDDPALKSLNGADGFSFFLTPEKESDDVYGAVIDTNITNLSGVQLPSTGGIGTTIFYVVGGILVAAAVILLVTKRRVSEK